jgi:hypothetical protein
MFGRPRDTPHELSAPIYRITFLRFYALMCHHRSNAFLIHSYALPPTFRILHSAAHFLPPFHAVSEEPKKGHDLETLNIPLPPQPRRPPPKQKIMRSQRERETRHNSCHVRSRSSSRELKSTHSSSSLTRTTRTAPVHCDLSLSHHLSH